MINSNNNSNINNNNSNKNNNISNKNNKNKIYNSFGSSQ